MTFYIDEEISVNAVHSLRLHGRLWIVVFVLRWLPVMRTEFAILVDSHDGDMLFGVKDTSVLDIPMNC